MCPKLKEQKPLRNVMCPKLRDQKPLTKVMCPELKGKYYENDVP
jgi:hypothetical protein